MQWGRILLTEVLFIVGVVVALGLVKAPRILMKRKLSPKFPWGYYADQVPQTEGNWFDGKSDDFLHDTGTQFGEGGDFGEFTGFGELGEYGGSFFSDGHGGGDGGF